MKIVLTSHGEFAKGILQSYEMIVGANDKISYVILDEDGIGKFSNTLKNKLDKILENDDALILCDLKGGTPYNESFTYALSHENRVRVISGLNLPMLIEVGLMDSDSIDEVALRALESGKLGIDLLSFEDNEDELEF
ncbi:PTS sugar transporter subunit IIA [Clostridium sp.]|uniref:PTS sugar transporter subunit IIA n=1 Tax=Clostridium sp. TaxID=1506 RepID=UPI00290F424F|nr:PTS sugar transporter subunit IIA [Clostridium sp.]MDU5106735.1 PTS sugar transporter subunit IIA [Clostridium sp.]